MSLTPVTLRNASDTSANSLKPSGNYATSTRLRLQSPGTGTSYTFLTFSRPFPLGAVVISATLKVYAAADSGTWGAQTRNMVLERISSAWKVSKLTYGSGMPNIDTAGAVTNTQTVAITDNFLWSFDITALMQSVANGTPFYGFRLRMDDTTLRRLYSTQALTQASGFNNKPTIVVTYAMPPQAPSTLSPSGNRSFSLSTPKFKFDFTDNTANTSLSAVNIQLNTTNVWTGTLTLDTGTFFTSVPELDLTNFVTAQLPAAMGNSGTFDTNITNWTAATNCSVARITTPVQAGAGALQMSSTAAGDMVAGTPTGTSGIPVIGSQTYSCSGWLRTAATARAAFISINWYTSAGTLISTVDGTSITNTTTYVLRSVTGIAPSNAAFARIQLTIKATGAAAELHDWDTFEFESGSNTTWAGFNDGDSLYWRVMVLDAGGIWSNWSNAAQGSRATKGVLTITNPAISPNNFVQESTPPITWTFTGRTQAHYQVIIQDSTGSQWLANSGKITGSATAWTIPAKVLKDGKTYTVEIRIWDTIARETVPGDPAYVVATRTFTYNLSGSVTVVTAFTGTDLTPTPGIQLNWTNTTAPDYYTIVRDGVPIAEDVLSGDVLVSGTSYQYIDRGPAPRVSHTWEIRRVVNGVTSTANPQVTKTITPIGVWLLDPTNNIQQLIMGSDPGTWSMGEVATNYEVLGASSIIRVTQGLRGWEGTITGTIGAYSGTGQTFTQALANMYLLKGNVGAVYRLVAASLNFPVVIGNVSIAPTPDADLNCSVSFDFWQTDELPFTASL